MNNLPIITKIPTGEQKEFDVLIKSYRAKYIRNSQTIVETMFKENSIYTEMILNQDVSNMISKLREDVWQEYLNDEVNFNALLMKDLHNKLETPRNILNGLVESEIMELEGEALIKFLKETCGEYAGRVFPYVYRLSLSNTQSRRSRAGSTFESIVYKVYETLDYEFNSQKKVGKKTFDTLGLGKKVDSILPGVEAYKKRRNKTIIGTMKTTLRERWQEVAEEIERTKIPEIHLLTVDEDISSNKGKEMSQHNIIVVAYKWVAERKDLEGMKNIISFEEYLFDELPSIYEYWSKND
ncbi:MAG: Type II restriction endonuclease [uncultured Sulfurovum sp.]|uniref:Type II restriction endonuclease n=1 Tax=uncultured Sulfurovum sp. TaxID=269237 RepID=A0A6S6S6Q5_9BACT|nr:MAG: Type II restriction endonuclease [uncultured Sulfurovum sp.]